MAICDSCTIQWKHICMSLLAMSLPAFGLHLHEVSVQCARVIAPNSVLCLPLMCELVSFMVICDSCITQWKHNCISLLAMSLPAPQLHLHGFHVVLLFSLYSLASVSISSMMGSTCCHYNVIACCMHCYISCLTHISLT
jgi:hypothetical protein